MPPNQVLLSFDKQLTASGWSPRLRRLTWTAAGFVANPFGGSFGNLYCADSSAVTVSYNQTAQRGTSLKVHFSRDPEGNFCTPHRMAMMRLPALKFPVLRPPPGMSERGGGAGSSGNNVSTSALLIGPLRPAEVIPHYLAQLQAAGWMTDSPASSGDASIASVEATDPEGKLWRGALIARRVSDSEMAVSIEMSRPGRY